MSASLIRSGSFASFTKQNSGITLVSDSFIYDVVFYKADVVRVHQYLQGQEDINPYSVIQEPESLKVTIAETDELITLQSDAMKVEINKGAIAFSFYDAAGKLINAQEPGLSMECQGTHKTVYNSLQANEKFIGLGE